jgi:hypothetical protein
MLQDTFTIGFAVSGDKNNWTISVTGPGNLATECQTQEETGYGLLDEMLSDMFAACCRKFPERAPKPPPPVAASKIKERIPTSSRAK